MQEGVSSGDIRVRAGLTAFPDNGAGRLYRDIDAAMIPDLMPILSVLAALNLEGLHPNGRVEQVGGHLLALAGHLGTEQRSQNANGQ